MTTARATFCAFLGRRWIVRCDRCAIDLPGRHCTRADAEAAGVAHVELRHGRVAKVYAA